MLNRPIIGLRIHRNRSGVILTVIVMMADKISQFLGQRRLNGGTFLKLDATSPVQPVASVWFSLMSWRCTL